VSYRQTHDRTRSYDSQDLLERWQSDARLSDERVERLGPSSSSKPDAANAAHLALLDEMVTSSERGRVVEGAVMRGLKEVRANDQVSRYFSSSRSKRIRLRIAKSVQEGD
jgi:hypothetical protein